MIKQDAGMQSAKVSKPLLGALGAIIVIGLMVFIGSKAQQSDPTLTAAPPTSSKAAPLQVSPAKSGHPGPMYTMTPAGPVANTSGQMPGAGPAPATPPSGQ